MPTRFCTACETTPIRADNATGKCRKCLDADRETDTLTDGLAVKGQDATLTKITSERVRTLADLIRVCEIDTTEWVIDRWIANKWEMGAKHADGTIATTPLYQIKAYLKRNRAVLDVRAEIASLLEDARDQIPERQRRVVRSPARSGSAGRRPEFGYLLEPQIPDLHLGKLAWAPETGYSDYDVKIAAEVFQEAVETLLARTKHFPIERIVFPLGNDWLNSDTKQGTTTRGTPLDNDSRYHKAFAIGRRLASQAIDRFREVAPVDVYLIPGNHDVLSTYHLGDSLSCLFHKTADVTIHNEPTLRKYHQYGKVALMFTHGDKGKSTDWPLLFATEQPEMFGSSRFREIHTGHYHMTRTTEHHGVRVRVSPALCPPDSWHSDNQFVGQQRGAEAYVWHKEQGLVTIAYFTPDAIRSGARRGQ